MPADIRGLSAFPYQLLAVCGIFLTNVINYIIGTEQARLRTDDIHASVKLETEMSHEFHDLFRPGLWKALVIGALIKA